MKLGNLPLVSLALFMAWGCSKETASDGSKNPPNASRLAELTIPSSFNWSSSVKGNLNLKINAPSYFTTEGQWLELRDGNSQILDRQAIKNGSVQFYLNFPQLDHNLYAHYPYTGESILISSAGNKVFKLAQYDLEGDPSNITRPSTKSTPAAVKFATGPNLIVNGNFDQSFSSDDTRGTGRLRNLGQWHRKNSFGVVASVNGQTVFTSSSSAQARIIQAVAVDPQYLYTVDFDYGGNASLLIYMFNKNQKLLGYTLPTKNGSSGTATIEVPANVEYLQVLAYTSNNGWIDNMTLARVDEPDTDNDGIVDRLDDYPQNATKSFASFYPLIGRQTLAFEDLWPHTGDFDFNDLVLSNLMEYGADTSGQLVDANYKVMVNANGAGIASGVAMVLLQPNGQPFNSNIVSSVSGDATLDPDVTNGIVVFDRISQALSKPYANNGQGHDGTPEEFEFQIGFNQNIGSSRVLADIYMFRAGERGREIHLDGFGPTTAADPGLFNTGQDVNGTYSTERGLPWAIEIVYPGTTFFKHPLEKVDILKAYPNFQTWAESNGSKQIGWMIHPNNDKVYNF